MTTKSSAKFKNICGSSWLAMMEWNLTACFSLPRKTWRVLWTELATQYED